jgi:hypothetical protein
VFIEYSFRYTQEGREIYLAEHAAIWFNGPMPASA